MAGCLDIVLDWGRGNALTEINGDVWVDDLAEGDTRYVYVPHLTTPFALYANPVIVTNQGVISGLVVDIVAMALIDGTIRVTNEEGFVMRVAVPTGVTGADQSRGGADADWHIYWIRRGVLNVA